jgi:hydroxymethylglutaryl-CoA synthase
MRIYGTIECLLKPDRPVGIIGYGAYVPRYRLPASEVARIWHGGEGGIAGQRKRRWPGWTKT